MRTQDDYEGIHQRIEAQIAEIEADNRREAELEAQQQAKNQPTSCWQRLRQRLRRMLCMY